MRFVRGQVVKRIPSIGGELAIVVRRILRSLVSYHIYVNDFIQAC